MNHNEHNGQTSPRTRLTGLLGLSFYYPRLPVPYARIGLART